MSAISKINVNGTNYDLMGLPVGTIFCSALPQINSGVHLLDGDYISTNGIYATFCDLVQELSQTYDILCTDAEYTEDLTATGNCGKFVLNTTNNTLRLPTITTFIQGLTDITTLGTAVEAGLPNITGSTNIRAGYNTMEAFGAFNVDVSYNADNEEGSGSQRGTISFDASRSSSIYGNSATVQPASVKYPYYIVLSTMKNTEIEVDIDEIASDLNGKLSNQVIHIINTYTNGSSGYRVWSNGFCEQWGITSGISDYGVATITFLKEFSSTDYIITTGNEWNSTGDDSTWIGAYCIQKPNKLTTGFKIYSRSATLRYISWLATGYLAQGEY